MRYGWGCRGTGKEDEISTTQSTLSDGRNKTPAQSDGARRVGRAAVIISTLFLVALTWLGARDAIRAHRTEARARVRAELLTKATSFEEELRRDLLSLDQTLRILEYEWERDPTQFDLAAHAKQTVVLNDVSLQLFIAGPQGTVSVSTRPAIIGTDVSKRDYFRYEATLPADDGKMFVGELTQGQVTHLWQINLVRRLDNHDGSFAGIIAASYDTNALSRFQHDVQANVHGLYGVVSVRDGEAWTFSEQAPSVVDIGRTPLFAAMQAARRRKLAGTVWSGQFRSDVRFRDRTRSGTQGRRWRRSHRGDAFVGRLGTQRAAVRRRHFARDAVVGRIAVTSR